MSLTFAKVRDGVGYALIVAGVLALASMAFDVKAIKVNVQNLDQRLGRLEVKMDRHVERHNK